MLDPRARALALVLAVLGAVLAHSVPLLAFGFVAVAVWALVCRILRQYLKFAFVTLLPITITLFGIWGWYVAAPPGSPPGSDPVGGMAFALTIYLRVAMLGGVIQLAFLTIPAERMPYTLNRCGIRGEGLIIWLGTLAVLPEVAHRAEQVFTARFALGAVENRSLLNRGRQLPHMLRPLFAWALRSAIHRAESWRQRQIFSRIEDFSADGQTGSVVVNAVCICLAIAWLGASVYLRFRAGG